MEPVRVDVQAATGAYPVLIGPGLIDHLRQILDDHSVGRRRFVVTNPVVWRLHGERIAAAMPGIDVIPVPDGERHKHLASVARIYDALVRGHADRGSAIVAIGGGVIGDMAGFVAATFMRGIGFVQVPTTLLAQVDASVGGKVGVNLPAGKNLVGSFYPPRLVVSDSQVLVTLSRREFRAGLYEVIKYGMACSAPLFARLQAESKHLKDPASESLGPIIADCCRIKASIVSPDERESGLRRVLNFGHTAGHAVEAITGYRRFRHGEAVAWGMRVASHLAVARGVLHGDAADALEALVTTLGPLPSITDLPVAQLIEHMRRDKKVVDGTLHVVLPTAIGTCTIADNVTETEFADSLRSVGFAE
jgi:3-dehydroquinate synthase